jgi:hypothetical protein
MAVEGPASTVDIGVVVQPKDVADVDPLEDEHAVLDLDFARGLTREPAVGCVDVTRLQRASEGARQSAGGGGDDVVERGRVFGFAVARNVVVVGDRVVDAEGDRLALCGQKREPQGTLHPFDPNLRAVHDITHVCRHYRVDRAEFLTSS